MSTPTDATTPSARPRSGAIFAPGVRSASVGATVLIAMFALEYIAVAAAMPTVAGALDGYHLYNMAFGATVALSVVGMIVAGWWSDRSGPSPVVVTGALAFAGGLLVAGLAPSMEVFVVGRGLQGLGSGLASVAIYVVIAQRIPDPLRPAVFSLLAAAWVLPGLAGPLLTGTLVEHLSWRWVFLGVTPAVLVAMWVLRPALRATHPSDDAGHLGGRIIGWAVLAAVGVGLLNLAGERVTRWEYAVGAVVVALLVLAARRLLPRGTLTLGRGLPSVVGVRSTMGGSFIAAEAYLPLMLRDEHGYSPAQAGAVLAVASCTWAFGSWCQARVAPGRDRYRLMLGGTTLYAVLMALLATAVWGSWPGWVVIGLYGVATLGVGIAYPTTSLLTMRLSPEPEIGRNSSALQVGEALTSALALAVTGVVFGIFYATAPHTAFVGTLVVAVAVGLLAVVSALRARPAQTRLPASGV
ncbi:MFS transporter [Serinicoccus kebangsaanensis]|uniref:MFS transporter n=1 Tax=Serinicoccus kebangsaanensis TaxID=2602069 RepID=UPI00124D1D09|nr:MFS transporter [Serinicoccus kebangsaanensis]